MVKHVFFTNDVETTSLVNHCLNDKTGEKVLKEGMPALLGLYQKYNVKSTFFFTGHIARLYPDVVRMIIPFGHEVGCHGLTHEHDQAFDVLSATEQYEHLKNAKAILEDLSGKPVISFRAPALRVNNDTPAALIKTGFLIDSSIASQRADTVFSFGAKEKTKWLKAPRKPYFTAPDNLARKGDSVLCEFPTPSYVLPYIGTFMRISPILTSLIRILAYLESGFSRTMPHFIIHPNEFIEEKRTGQKINRRAKNFLSYLLADKLRYHLKLKNLGKPAIKLFENQIKFFNKRGYQSITLKKYYDNYIK